MHEVITCLEMTAPTQLVRGRPPPAPLEMEEVDSAAAPLVRSIYVRIWDGLASGARMAWSDAEWEDELSRPGVRSWVAARSWRRCRVGRAGGRAKRGRGDRRFRARPRVCCERIWWRFSHTRDGDGVGPDVPERRRLDEARVRSDLVRRSSACATELQTPRLSRLSRRADKLGARLSPLTGDPSLSAMA